MAVFSRLNISPLVAVSDRLTVFTGSLHAKERDKACPLMSVDCLRLNGVARTGHQQDQLLKK
jgi:hypothetical protein